MENADLKWIKKHYGEKFAHLCRELFPTILETEGLLKKILQQHFLPSRELYDDIVNQDLTIQFKNYIYNFIDKNDENVTTNLSPEQLMRKAGYTLYPECKTEADVQSFRHYYHRGEPTPVYTGGTPVRYGGEELCTFSGGRLNSCRVWFAVRDGADKLKREDFKKPRREDDYGTSVISIQFTKTDPSTLSIKNRYNHTITDVNPDATYGNNLDNIIEGLTQSFIDNYGINLANSDNESFELPGYIQANNGMYYKYNMEINNVYFCPGNVLIINGKPKVLDPERYILFDHFALDLKAKIVFDCNTNLSVFGVQQQYNGDKDCFPDSIGQIREIKRQSNEGGGITIQITPDDGDVVEITLNRHNEIVGYSNPNATQIGDKFLQFNQALERIDLPNVEEIGNYFLPHNQILSEMNLPQVEWIGNSFIRYNQSLTKIDLPYVKWVGNGFIHYNESLTKIDLPNVEQIGHNFIRYNQSLSEINLPQVEQIGDNFMCANQSLTKIDLPNVKQIGSDFLYYNASLTGINLPQVRRIGDDFLYCNTILSKLNLPNIGQIGNNFLFNNESLTEIDLPKVQKIGNNFLPNNKILSTLNLPNSEQVGNGFLFYNTSLIKIDLPNVEQIGNYFLYYNRTLSKLNLPNIEQIGNEFLYCNELLNEINLPVVQQIGGGFLYSNESLTKLNIPNIKQIGDGFLHKNKILTELNLPDLDRE